MVVPYFLDPFKFGYRWLCSCCCTLGLWGKRKEPIPQFAYSVLKLKLRYRDIAYIKTSPMNSTNSSAASTGTLRQLSQKQLTLITFGSNIHIQTTHCFLARSSHSIWRMTFRWTIPTEIHSMTLKKGYIDAPWSVNIHMQLRSRFKFGSYMRSYETAIYQVVKWFG